MSSKQPCVHAASATTLCLTLRRTRRCQEQRECKNRGVFNYQPVTQQVVVVQAPVQQYAAQPGYPTQYAAQPGQYAPQPGYPPQYGAPAAI